MSWHKDSVRVGCEYSLCAGPSYECFTCLGLLNLSAVLQRRKPRGSGFRNQARSTTEGLIVKPYHARVRTWILAHITSSPQKETRWYVYVCNPRISEASLPNWIGRFQASEIACLKNQGGWQIKEQHPEWRLTIICTVTRVHPHIQWPHIQASPRPHKGLK